MICDHCDKEVTEGQECVNARNERSGETVTVCMPCVEELFNIIMGPSNEQKT